MSGAIKIYSMGGSAKTETQGQPESEHFQMVTTSAIKSFFNNLNTLLSKFTEEWGIERVSHLTAFDTLLGETSGTIYFTEAYKVNGFDSKYLAFTIGVNYLGFASGTSTARTANFRIEVYDSIPPTKSTTAILGFRINYQEIPTDSSHINIQKYPNDIYWSIANIGTYLQITRTLNFLFINIPYIQTVITPQYSGLSANGYGIAKLTNKETDEVYTFIARGNYTVAYNTFGYLALYDTDNSSRATNVLFPTLTNNLVDITHYTVSSDVYLTTNVEIIYNSSGTRQGAINGNTTIDKSKPIKNLIQTPSFFTSDYYYTVDGKPYLALYANLLSEFDPNYVFPGHRN